MLARSGEITEPWPVPLSLTVTTPSSRTPALSHFWIRRSMRVSLIRCFRKRISHCWLTESSAAACSADEGEAQKVEGLRFSEPPMSAALHCEAAELDQTGLLRME